MRPAAANAAAAGKIYVASDRWPAWNQSEPFSLAPALKRTPLLARILIGSPVRGLRPMRADRLLTWNEPKPGMLNFCAFLSSFAITPVTASTALLATVVVRPVFFSASTSACLLITLPFHVGGWLRDRRFYSVIGSANRRSARITLSPPAP